MLSPYLLFKGFEIVIHAFVTYKLVYWVMLNNRGVHHLEGVRKGLVGYLQFFR